MKSLISIPSSSSSPGDAVAPKSISISKSAAGSGGFIRFCGKYLGIGRNHDSQSPPPPPPPPIQSPALRHYNTNKSSVSGSGSGRDELHQVFTYFDDNGDGKISPSELQTCLRAVGSCHLSDEDAEEAVRCSDSDGDGMLGFHDFAKLMETTDDEELRGAFGMYSGDDGVHITPKSLKKMLTKLGQSTSTGSCKAMISRFDLNGDGLLNFEEFRIMMH